MLCRVSTISAAYSQSTPWSSKEEKKKMSHYAHVKLRYECAFVGLGVQEIFFWWLFYSLMTKLWIVIANSARMRLMRLSEAAEKLRRQAAISVQTGKENDARGLLFQKKKVMQAMEKSKSRIELLDELAQKLYEAISVKESQLIGNVATDLATGEVDPSPVRIISPTEEDQENLDSNFPNQAGSEKLQQSTNNQADLRTGDESTNGKMRNKMDMLHSSKEISSYEDFLEHLDDQLHQIEAELVTFLEYSTLVLENKEKPENPKVSQALEILDCIRHIRGRIASIADLKVETG